MFHLWTLYVTQKVKDNKNHIHVLYVIEIRTSKSEDKQQKSSNWPQMVVASGES